MLCGDSNILAPRAALSTLECPECLLARPVEIVTLALGPHIQRMQGIWRYGIGLLLWPFFSWQGAALRSMNE
jgi:hypothetical protein